MGSFVENVNKVANVITSGVLDPNAEGYSNAVIASNMAAISTSMAEVCTNIYDKFDDRYLGSKSIAPMVDNDGNPLVYGALFFDNVNNFMKVWSNAGWINVGSSETAYTVATVEDLVSVPSDYTTAIVKDLDRGGIFIWSAAGTANGGTVFAGATGFWNRQYSGAVNVKWFGAKTDGTDNTSVYTAIINSIPEGATIEWTPEAYTGDFVSKGKSFKLKGNGATLTANGNFAIFFDGSLGNYNTLTVAPAHNDVSLSGITGLTTDSYLLLYSGNTRPSDNAAVNYEIVKVKPDGTVYDKIYSDQNGGTPVYAVITPVEDIEVDGFNIAGNTSCGVFIRYGVDVKVSNVKMNGGSDYTITLSECYNVTAHHIKRIKPSAVGSGQGYNMGCNTCKYGKIYSIYGEETRHEYDQDSSYVMDISNVISVNAASASIVVAHNSYGGYTTVRDCTIKGNSYAVCTLSQGFTNPMDGLIRELTIENIKITNTKNRNAYDYYVGIYSQYPSENLYISNITINNESTTTFDYPGSAYNTGYCPIRIYDPRKNTEVKNVAVDFATSAVWFDNVTNQNCNVDIDLINIELYRDLITITAIGSDNLGNFNISNLRPYESSTVYGNAIVAIYEPTHNLRRLMIKGLYQMNYFAKVVKLANNTVRTPEGKIDTAGFARRRSSLSSLVSGGTITQNEFLSAGDFAIWGGTSITLNTTVPIERPVTSGDIFGIYNYGSGTLTIPGNSETVENASDILIQPSYLYVFQSNTNKWRLMKKVSGITLS